MKSSLILLLLTCVVTAHAEDVVDSYASGQSAMLTDKDRAALAISKKWSSGDSTGVSPAVGKNGSVVFVYGTSQPSIVCAVLQVCDIALQAGEQVNGVNLGDSARWTIEPAVSGTGTTATQHLIVKPLDVALETSLVVATDRRTYYMVLKSHRNQYMPQVSFAYPEEQQARISLLQQQRREEQERQLLSTGENINHLDFHYAISGDAPWKPLRVYNDGEKTYIEMPKSMAQTEAPTLLVVREHNAITSNETVLVNYRLQNQRYIVDSVFETAVLVAGVGRRQTRVTIERGEQHNAY